jgi:FG-GAP-like repeat
MKEATIRQGMLGTLGTLGAAVLTVAMLAGGGLSGCVFYLNPLCDDQIHNGEETDIDCGGTCAKKCSINDSCSTTADCDDSNCVRGTCTAKPCDNGKLDPGETDVDCGGETCRKCSGGRQCLVASDCFNATCLAGSKTCSSLTMMAFAPAVTYLAGAKPYALFSGDLNADGRIDLAVANELGSSISVFLNNGAGVFQSLPPVTTGAYPTGGTLADFNHDGVLDVVTADYHGNSVSVLLGVGAGTPIKGTGALGPAVSYPTVAGGETSNLAVGDLNRDNNLDVVATNQAENSVSVFLGLDGGALAPGVTLPVGTSGASHPFSAAIGDFNGDGNDDVAIGDNTSGTIRVRLGNGDGTLQAEVPYPVGGQPGYVIITSDLDLDGQLDLVSANRSSDDISVLLGRGDGTFRKAIASPAGVGSGPYSVAVADFNKDGVPDVITANFMSNNASVLLGIGNGHFEVPIDAGPTDSFCYGVAVGDFDGDTVPDFATANALGGSMMGGTMTVKISTSH